MYLHVPFGTSGLGQGAGTPQTVLSAARKRQILRHRGLKPGVRFHLHFRPVRSQQVGVGAENNVRRSKADGSENGAGAALDFGSVFRSVFDFNTQKVTSAAAAGAAVSATAPSAAVAAIDARTSIPATGQNAAEAAAIPSAPAVPPGPFADTEVTIAVAGVQPMAALAEQVLSGHDVVQDDPVAAARQLQLFLSQYKDQYGPETDARISAAVAKLQDYIQGYSLQQQGGATEGLDGMAVSGALGSAVGMAADSGASSVGGVYHNYILEQLTGVLDWVNNLLVNKNPKPYVFDAYGRVMENPAAVASLEQQQEQLRAASNSLRVLIQQLQQVNRQYAAMADSDEKAAMGQVLSQLTTMADRLAVAATRRPLPPAQTLNPTGAADAAVDMAPYVRPEQFYGAENYRDPLLRVLDGVYQAVVVDSGLREFLAGIKQLGDSLVASMTMAWTGAPPIGRLIAYIAAVAGVLFVMRTRLPPALLAPTKIFGQLGTGARGSGSASGPESSSVPTESGSSTTPTVANPAAAAAFAAIAANSNGSSNGPATAAAAAAAFAAIAANGSVSSNTRDQAYTGPLEAMDRDANLGDTRLPSEILASNGSFGSLIEAEATPFTAGSGTDRAQAESAEAQTGMRRTANNSVGFGNGWATLTGTAASSSGAPATNSGLFTTPSFPSAANMARTAAGGASDTGSRTDWGNDRSDWWNFGQNQNQIQPQAAAPSPPLLPPPAPSANSPAPRAPTVAESWEAFRRIQEPAPMESATAVSSGMLDTTAALAAAAVAAAAVGGGGGPGVNSSDPKMAELARAADERRLFKDRARLRATIKDRLRWVCLALGPVSSVVPGGEPLREEVDGLLAQLEALSPTDKPLNTVVDAARRPTVGVPAPLVDPLLLGEWRLVYASNASATAGAPSAASQAAGGGPNLLAQILHIADSLPGFGMTHVVQRLMLEPQTRPKAAAGGGGSGAAAVPATILTENSAVFRFGPLGSWRVCVRGRWVDNGGGLCAAAEFESFSVRPVDLWGLPVEELLPEVAVPVPDVLRSRSEWCTTYLDEEMRIGRGSGGALFLFRRGAAEGEPTAATAPPPLPKPQAAPAAVAAAAAAPSIQQPVMRPL